MNASTALTYIHDDAQMVARVNKYFIFRDPIYARAQSLQNENCKAVSRRDVIFAR